MKKTLAIGIAAFLLFALCACSAETASPGETTSTTESTSPEESTSPTESTSPEESTSPDDPSPTGENGDIDPDERISFITQSYEGDNIVEIPYFEYGEGVENPEIDSINRLFNQGYQMRYEEFLDSKLEQEWIEIKTYPFTTGKYMQVAITQIIYPNYGTDGDIESVNYDRVSKKWLSNQDALEKFSVTEDDVLADVGEVFVPEYEGEVISKVEIGGFLIRESGGAESLELLLKLTTENLDGDPNEQFFSYYPDGKSLTRLNSFCLFDPYDMDEMNPPLWYQQHADAEQTLTHDILLNNKWEDADTGEVFTFDQAEFIELNENWEDNPEGLYYSLSSENIVSMFNDGAHLKDHYYLFDPASRTLTEFMFDDVISRMQIVS